MRRRIRILQLAVAVTAACLSVPLLRSASVAADPVPAAVPSGATHKQTRVIRPQHQGQPVTLNTFCVDADGNLLVCVTAAGADPSRGENSDSGSGTATQSATPAGYLQTYSSDGELLREVALAFAPTAVNQAPDGSVFVAGSGRVARVSAGGDVLADAASPHLGDPAEMRKKAEEGAKAQLAQVTESFNEQIKRLDQRIAAIRKKPEEEISERDRSRLTTYENQKEMYAEQARQMEVAYGSMFSVDAMLANATGITALAVTSRDVFLCCRSLEGHGYEVWRLDHEFSSPTRVVTGLNGCCGQCDIQATEDHLILAENTNFKVALLDRDGNRQSSFGERDRTRPEGFGSCCNPMNVRCCANGDILTAESSIGTIKRFSTDGKYQGTVGKAKIGGGCKHVALGFDPELDRYYLMNVDKSHICVLIPTSEAPEFTDDELAAKIAMDGLGQKVIGDWTRRGVKPRRSAGAPGPFESLLLSLLGGSTDSEAAVEGVDASSGEEALIAVTFQSDGTLKLQGGSMSGQQNSWAPVRQDGNVLTVSQQIDGAGYYDLRIEFQSDDEAVISVTYGDQVLSTAVFERARTVVTEAEASEETTEGIGSEVSSDSPSGGEE